MAKQFVIIPAVVPRHPKMVDHNRHLKIGAGFGWLASGWRDLMIQPASSLIYGLFVAILSALVVWAMTLLGWDQVLFPAISGFLIVAPLLATGLYEKSRRIEAGERVALWTGLFPKRSGGQNLHLLYVGAILGLLMMVWMRAAVLLYALFFGLRPFPGFSHVTSQLFNTQIGISLLITGTVVGGVFAAFAFAISALSIPMMLDKRMDAFSAMATSVSLVWNNLPAMLVWAAIVLGLTLAGLATGLIGLIVVFPLLGHATWHAYAATREKGDQK